MPTRVQAKNRRRRLDRLHILGAVFLIIFLLIGWRLFQLQILEAKFFQALAAGQYQFLDKLTPQRGEIYVSDNPQDDRLKAIAVNRKMNLLYAVPDEIAKPQATARQIAQLLSIKQEILEKKFTKKGDPWEPIRHFVPDETANQITALDPGIKALPEINRYYLEGELFAHVTGFLGFQKEKRKGQYGIEDFWEETLRGKEGKISLRNDLNDGLLALGKNLIIPAEDGADIVLTLNYTVQFQACNIINEAREQFQADSGQVIVAEPATGRILALCVTPTFDPNNYSSVESLDIFINPVVSQPYEPGSVFKIITMAAALETKSVTPQTEYVDEGAVKFGPYLIKNSDKKVYGKINMIEVLKNSVNTGAIFAALTTGRDDFRKIVKDFGFGQITGIGLPAEQPGNITALEKEGEVYLATASFGQGITVTPLQMLQAVSAVANQGLRMKPYLVKEIRFSDGTTKTTKPQRLNQVISSKTATILSAMLVAVVEQGQSQAARVDGYHIAGKTGTAQIPQPNKRGYTEETIHTFVGFAPVEKPRFSVLVKLDKPKRGRFAANTVGQVFGKIIKFLINYYQIPPSTLSSNQ